VRAKLMSVVAGLRPSNVEIHGFFFYLCFNLFWVFKQAGFCFCCDHVVKNNFCSLTMEGRGWGIGKGGNKNIFVS